MRRFRFEADIYESLDCVPMAARRKLDRIGLKVSLEQWQRLRSPEHLAICHMPAESPDECAALREVIVDRKEPEQFRAKELAAELRSAADPSALPPSLHVSRAKAAGFDLTDQVWQCLDEDERYVPMKLGNEKAISHNLPSARGELIK